MTAGKGGDMETRGRRLPVLAAWVMALVVFHGAQALEGMAGGAKAESVRGKGAEGKTATVEGRISGLDCFLEAELCGPDHVWKKGEVAGLVTDDFIWYYLGGSKTGNGIPRDVLVQFFLAKTRVKGTLYGEVVTFLRPEMEVWQDGQWVKVWPPTGH
ncbi:MAG: hypothetical protein ACE5GH_00090 [Fidelibacterota bacterium]